MNMIIRILPIGHYFIHNGPIIETAEYELFNLIIMEGYYCV